VRAYGWFNIQTSAGVVQNISHQRCKVLQRGDGYGYSFVAKHWGKESDKRGDAWRRRYPFPASMPGLSHNVKTKAFRGSLAG